MSEDVPWSGIHARVTALPTERRACFALGCAERLVRTEASARQTELLNDLSEGWSALLGRGRDLDERRRTLAARADLDQDEVASVAFALDAVVDGTVESALWASGRALDAAYARIPYPPGATRARPFAVDTASPVVQAELAWQADAADVMAGPDALAELVSRFRS